MSPSFIKHFLLDVDPPGRVVSDIIVMFRPIVDSTSPPRHFLLLQILRDSFFCFLDLLEVVGVFFPVDVVWIFVVTERSSASVEQRYSR